MRTTTESYEGQALVQKSARRLAALLTGARTTPRQTTLEIYGGFPHLMRDARVWWPDGEGGELCTVALPVVMAEVEADHMRREGWPAAVRLEVV
jgi:hypothetical protein